MIPCGLSSSLPFQRRAKACFCDARSIFMSLPDGSGTAAVPDDTKAVTAYLRAGSNAQALRGCGTGTQIISTGTVFQCAPTAADPAAAAGANLRKLGLNGMFSAGRAFFVRRCAPRSRYPAPGEILLVGEGRCAQLYLVYSKHSSRCQTASSQFFVRRCAPRAAVFLYSKRGSRCMAENFYQLALRTPGIWPLYASSRKQIRQMP